MRVTLFSAVSLNGFIARQNGDEDFLSHANWASMEELAKKHRNFVIGRKTYEAVQNWGERYNFDTIKGVDVRVLLSQTIQEAPPGFSLAREPHQALEILKSQGCVEALLIGGSRAASSFLKQKLVDEIILNIEPVLIPEGIPFFAADLPDTDLRFAKANPIGGGIIQLSYEVAR